MESLILKFDVLRDKLRLAPVSTPPYMAVARLLQRWADGHLRIRLGHQSDDLRTFIADAKSWMSLSMAITVMSTPFMWTKLRMSSLVLALVAGAVACIAESVMYGYSVVGYADGWATRPETRTVFVASWAVRALLVLGCAWQDFRQRAAERAAKLRAAREQSVELVEMRNRVEALANRVGDAELAVVAAAQQQQATSIQQAMLAFRAEPGRNGLLLEAEPSRPPSSGRATRSSTRRRGQTS